MAFAAVRRLLAPHALEQLGLGLAVSTLAALVNLAVALVIRRAGRRHSSVTLEANAQHLLTDVWTSAGVLVGVGAVALSGLRWLDPVVALLVSANIVWTGMGIVRRCHLGLMDSALSPAEQLALQQALAPRPRARAGARAALAPVGCAAVRVAACSCRRLGVQRGLSCSSASRRDIRRAIPTPACSRTQMLDDPASWDDIPLDRDQPPSAAS
jgi:hypothetical protein